MNWIKLAGIASGALLVLTIVFTCAHRSSRPVFSCVGNFSTEITLRDKQLAGSSDIMITVFSDKRLLILINGSLLADGDQFRISRELWLKWEVIDREKGIIRASLISEQASGADNAPSEAVNIYMLGAEPGGTFFQFRQLQDRLYLIGSSFSPVVSCVRTD